MIPQTCFAFRIRKANRILSQVYDHHLAECNIKISQFNILQPLYFWGKTTSKTLYTFLALDQSTMSRNLRPLIRDDFVVITEGEDRREKILSLSKSGVRLYKEAFPKWEGAQNEVKKRLGSEHINQLLEMTSAVSIIGG